MNEDLILTIEDYKLTRDQERCILFAYCDPVSPMAKAIQKMGLWQQYLNGTAQIPPAARKAGSGAPWTIGYGHTGPEVYEGVRWSQDQANSQLMHDMEANVAAVKKAVTREMTREQLIALADLTHNIGAFAMKNSTLIRLFNEGKDEEAADQFRVWNKSGGHVVEGLVNRREADRAMFLLGSTLT
jgi:lysozyme